tara:strand:+ start:640 stop:1059 length:420 start_codon:yes stop_codon:yes gene_type:complete
MKSYSEIAKEQVKLSEIKIKTEYVEDFNYDDNWIYLPRIYACDYRKAKVRILKTGIDRVKNCIKITFNPDRHKKDYIEFLVKNKLHLIKYHLHGSCQTFLTISNLEQLLVCYDVRNKISPDLNVSTYLDNLAYQKHKQK